MKSHLKINEYFCMLHGSDLYWSRKLTLNQKQVLHVSMLFLLDALQIVCKLICKWSDSDLYWSGKCLYRPEEIEQISNQNNQLLLLIKRGCTINCLRSHRSVKLQWFVLKLQAVICYRTDWRNIKFIWSCILIPLVFPDVEQCARCIVFLFITQGI